MAKRALWFYALALLVVVLDQATKLAAEHWLGYREVVPVTPFFNFTLAYNPGAAFSFLADSGGWQRWFFSLLAVVISVILAVWLWRLKEEERVMAWPLSLIIGGAVGNLIDRLAYGHVIDFLDFYYGEYHWPAFNLADSAIVCGAGLMIWLSFFPPRTQPSDGAR